MDAFRFTADARHHSLSLPLSAYTVKLTYGSGQNDPINSKRNFR
jgi:hypothetical protein